MLLSNIQNSCKIRSHLLIMEINELKQRMIEVYEQSENLQNPILIQLSEILDRRLNEFSGIDQHNEIHL